MDRTTRRRRASIAMVAALAVFAALVLSGLPTERGAVVISNLVQFASPAAAAYVCWKAALRARRDPERRAWKLLGASAGSWSAGQMVWTYYEVTGAAAPFPSLADVGYLLAVPLALAGVFVLAFVGRGASRSMAVVDGLIVAVALLGVSWPLVLGPSWDAGGDDRFTFALSLAYPVGNLVVCSAVLVAIMRSGRRAGSVALLPIAGALLVLVGADSVFVWTTLRGTEQAVSVADVGWVAGYLVLLLGALHYEPDERRDQTVGHAGGSVKRALLPSALATVALVVRVAMFVAGHRSDEFLNAVTVCTVALVLSRHLMTMWENQQLTRSLQQKISQLTKREQQLSHQAFHDPLTGLANRRLFSARVDHALAEGVVHDHLTAVLFVDLDDFKTVNDSLGHAAGDRLLAAVSDRLRSCVRPVDTVARLGGDEFGILLEQVEHPDQPAIVAQRVLDALEVPVDVAGRQVFTRASVGLAHTAAMVLPDGGEPRGDQLLADADVALYAAKEAGKSTFRIFEGAMRISAIQRLELGQDLRRAAQEDQFLCHYQPIVDLVTGRIVAVEALVRWDHPQRGLLAPGAFIDMAEETGIIGAVGRQVLEAATHQAAAWHRASAVPPTLELHVNLSGRQLEDDTLIEDVRAVLATSGLPPALLVLEITESVAVDIGARHLDRLNRLRDLGVRLAIDDFGTGYSSLNYLRALPVDVLKIDRAFAETMDGATDAVLLEAIVRLGHSLGIQVVAEGIERDEQAATLRRLGCRRAQGYLFHRPAPASEIPGLMSTRIVAPGVGHGADTPMPPPPPIPAFPTKPRQHHRQVTGVD